MLAHIALNFKVSDFGLTNFKPDIEKTGNMQVLPRLRALRRASSLRFWTNSQPQSLSHASDSLAPVPNLIPCHNVC